MPHIIDANLHLCKPPSVAYELDLHNHNIPDLLTDLSTKLIQNKIEKGLVYCLDPAIQWENYTIPENVHVSAALTLDTSVDDCANHLKAGTKILKIHPYHHNIDRNDYEILLDTVDYVSSQGGVITICGSYGTGRVYDTNGVELAAYLRKHIDIPVIIAHGGMTKIFDTFSLASEYDNLYMDISFALDFWWGSNLIQDYAFVAKKLEYEQIFYGSDYPYVSFEHSISFFEEFCNQFEFSEENKQKIYYGNFSQFEKKYL